MRHVSFLRWTARTASIAILGLFAILFVQDGLPVFLFGTDASHMVALSVMLLGLAVGWKWEVAGGVMVIAGYLTDLVILNLRFGTMSLDMGPIVTIMPVVGIAYLYVGWRARAFASPSHDSGGGGGAG